MFLAVEVSVRCEQTNCEDVGRLLTPLSSVETKRKTVVVDCRSMLCPVQRSAEKFMRVACKRNLKKKTVDISVVIWASSSHRIRF